MQLENLDGETLVNDLVRMLYLISGKPTEHLKSLRLAVTQEEMAAIRAYCFKRDPTAPFYVRLRGVPLVVEADALDPPVCAEWNDRVR